MKRGIVALACASVWWLGAGNAAAQDLFELEVFEYDSAEPGRSELELHANAISGRTVPPESVAEGHSPAHISVELTHVWTRRFESALFLQTAPFGSTRTRCGRQGRQSRRSQCSRSTRSS